MLAVSGAGCVATDGGSSTDSAATAALAGTGCASCCTAMGGRGCPRGEDGTLGTRTGQPVERPSIRPPAAAIASPVENHTSCQRARAGAAGRAVALTGVAVAAGTALIAVTGAAGTVVIAVAVGVAGATRAAVVAVAACRAGPGERCSWAFWGTCAAAGP